MGFLESLGNTAKSFGKAAVAGPGVIYDTAMTVVPGDQWGGADDDGFSVGSLLNNVARRAKSLVDPVTNDDTFTGYGFTKTMHAFGWAYKEGVDQPISTAMMMAQHSGLAQIANPFRNPLDLASGDYWSNFGKLDNVLDGEAWADAYAVADKQSLGQTVLTNWSDVVDPRTLIKPGDGITDPLSLDPAKGTPYKQNAFVQAHPRLAYAGALGVDLGVSWYLDPGVLLGKTASVARTHGLGKLRESDIPDLNDVLAGSVAGRRDWAGRIDEYFRFINGDNRTKAPLSGPQIYAITPELKRSSAGRAISGLLADSMKIEDVAQRENAARRIVAVAAGDTTQIDRLASEIPGTEEIVNTLRNISNESTVKLKRQALKTQSRNDPAFRVELQRQLDGQNLDKNVTKFVDEWKSSVEHQLNAQKVLQDSAGQLDNLPGKTPLLTSSRLRRETGATLPQKVSAAHDAALEGVKRLGNRDSYSSVFQKSLYHVPYIVVRPVGWGVGATTKAPLAIANGLRQVHYQGTVNLHDWETASDQLDAMMRLADVDDATRAKELQRAYLSRTEPDKKRTILRVENAAMQGLAASLSKRHGIAIDADFIRAAMLRGQDERDATMASIEGTRAYSATKMNGDPNALRVDQVLEQDGVPLAVPVLTPQLSNDIPLFDVDFAKRVSSDAAWVRRLGDHSQLWADTAQSMNGLKGELARALTTGDKSAVRLAQRSIENKQKVFDSILEVANTAQRWWKMSVLFRLGYPQRVVADDHMRIGAHMGYAPFMAANLSEASANVAYNIFGRRKDAKALYNGLRAQRAQVQSLLGREGIGRDGFTDTHWDELRTLTKARLKKGTPAAEREAAQARMNELDPDGRYFEYAEAVHEAKAVDASVRGLRRSVKKMEADGVPDAAALREKRAQLAEREATLQVLAENLGNQANPADLYDHLRDTDAILKAGKKPLRGDKRHVGEADVVMGDGTTYEGVFGRTGGGTRAASGSTQVNDQVWDAMEQQGVRLASTGNHRIIPAVDGLGEPTPGHLETWANVLNHQFLNSPEMMAFVKGDVATVPEFVKWIKKPENRYLTDRMEQYAHDPEGWGSRIQQMFLDYIPNEELRVAVSKGRVNAKELRKMFPDPKGRPNVHGQLTDIQTGRFGPTRWASASLQNMFRYLADVPTDTLSRHPFMNAVYKSELQKAHNVRAAAYAKTGQQFSPDDIAHIERIARQKALTELKRTLWDVSAHSSAAHTMRFVSPFFAAHQEALSRWWRIASDDPSVVRRFQLAFDAPRKAGLTYNAETGEVQAGDQIGGGNRILLRLPGPATKGINAWIKSIGGDHNWSVNEQGANLILQNGVANPGVGPLVSIPMEALVQHYADEPDLLAVARVINAYPPQATGFSGIATQSLMPAWMRNATALAAEQDIPIVSGIAKTLQGNSDIYARLYMQNYADKLITFEKSNDGRKPTDEEWDQITKDAGTRTNMDLLLMTTSNLVAFTPARPESKYALVQHGLQRIQEQARQSGEDQDWVREQFKAQFEDVYLPMIYSLGANPGRLDQTGGEVKAMKRYRGLLDKLDVSLQRMVIGPEAAMDAEEDPDLGRYSDAARNYEKGQETQPGSGENYIGSRNRREASLKVLINQGWEQYDQLTNALDVYADQQGLDSYEDSPQLVAAKRAGLKYIKENNFAFRNDFDSFSHGGFDAKLDDMQQIASNKQLLNDPMRSDVKLLAQYLEMRRYFTGLLAERSAAGGASTMTAKANDDLARAFRVGVNYLTKKNTYFKRFAYEGGIEFDPYLSGTEDNGD